ncbi:MAG: hypothetical protein U1F83_10170 [Verrucomicrobiota bacterium]
MPRHILYAYVDGADLEDVAEFLHACFAEFVASRDWIAGHASIVNQRHGRETCTQPENVPGWDLGVNLELPNPGVEPQGWFADIEAVARFLGKLHKKCNRDFIVGIKDTQSRISDDLFVVSTDSPDIDKLRAIIGVRELE